MTFSFWWFILIVVSYFEAAETVSGEITPWIGCFSKDNVDKVLSYSTSKVFRFKENIQDTRECSGLCKGFDLIGIQYQVCVCIKLPIKDQLIQYQEECCKYVGRNDATHFGGFETFSLYCVPPFACSGLKDSIKYIKNSECQNPSEETEQKAIKYKFESFTPSKIKNSIEGLRFNKDGEVCQDLENIHPQTNVRDISGAIQFFIKYTPGLKGKHYLCQTICEDSKNSHKNNCPVVFELHSSILGNIELCQCSSNLADFQPQKFEICSTCPTDLRNAEIDCSSQKENVTYFYHESNDCEITKSSTVSWWTILLLLGGVTLITLATGSLVYYCNATGGTTSTPTAGESYPLTPRNNDSDDHSPFPNDHRQE